MSLRFVESTSLPPSGAYQQCIHGKSMNQRCDDCTTLRLLELRATNLIKRLVDWAGHMGGWEAPVWKEAKQFPNEPAETTDCDECGNPIPDTEASEVNSYHKPECSLHPSVNETERVDAITVVDQIGK